MTADEGDRRDRLVSALTSLAAGVAAVAGSYAVVRATPEFVVVPVSAAVTELTPDAVVTWAILELGDLGQSLAFAAALALTVCLLSIAVALGRAAAVRLDNPFQSPLGAFVGAAAAAFGLSGSAASGAGAGVGAAAVAALTDVRTTLSSDFSARRRVIRAGIAAVGAVALGSIAGSRPDGANGSGGDSATVAPPPPSELDPPVAGMIAAARERSLDLDGVEGLLTEEEFYRVDINGVDPDPSIDDWSLSVTGAVDSPREFSFDDLAAMPAEHRFVTLRCVGDSLNGDKIDTALWTGVPASTLLEAAGVDDPGNCCVMLRAVDGYDGGFPMSAFRDALFAYRMNGNPLPRSHGSPVRALVPGHWGEINVKWLSEIELLDAPERGYWERRGWHGTGPVNTVAKLHSVSTLDDGRVRVGGHAYAGTRGVERVEVSTDGGETWTEATLSPPLPGRIAADAGTDAVPEGDATDAWRMWFHEYASDRAHRVVVRAVDGTGAVQPEEEASPFPRGASGWVSRRVDP